MKNFLLKVDVYGKDQNYVFEWGQYSPFNMSSVVRSLSIRKSINFPVLEARLQVSPDRGPDGKTWAERLTIMDTITISTRTIGSNGQVREDLAFFGFITNRVKTNSFGDNAHTLIDITCRSIDFFLTTPLLAFDKITNPLAQALGAQTDIWTKLAVTTQRPHEIAASLVDVFKSYVSTVKPRGGFTSDIGTLLPYVFASDALTEPMAFALLSAANDGTEYQGSFWSALADVAEIRSGYGWIHEMFIDLVDETRFNALVKFAQDNYTNVKTPSAYLPVKIGKSPSSKNYYFILSMRPNPLPRLVTGLSSSLCTTVKDLTALDSSVSLSASSFDSLMNNNTLSHTLTSLISTQEVQSADQLNTIFTMWFRNIDRSGNYGYMMPVVIDKELYETRGHSPLKVSTRYVATRTQDFTGAISPLFSLNLISASYNLKNVYLSGSVVVPYNPEISVGDICMATNEKLSDTLIVYVERLIHNINPGGVSTTTIMSDRILQDTTYQNLENVFKSRIYLAPSINFRKYLEDQLHPQYRSFVKSLSPDGVDG